MACGVCIAAPSFAPLRLEEHFSSDRFLRIRHGAATFLRQTRQSPDWECHEDISAYATDEGVIQYNLNLDLIEILNFLNMVGDLVEEGAILESIVLERSGIWILNYYRAGEQGILKVRGKRFGDWKNLVTL